MISVLLLQLVLLIGVALTIVRLGDAQDEIVRSQEQAANSRALASDLRQSSDDLTRFARTFVVTGEKKFLRYFDMVLAIRNGELVRPVGYGGHYWDAVVAGDFSEPTETEGAVSLRERMETADFSSAEFALLEAAQARSDALVALEEQAFAAMDRYFLSGEEKLRAEALELLHGDQYHARKAAIMAPIGSFTDEVEVRVTSRLDEANADAARYRTILMALTFAMFLVLTGASWLIQRRVVQRVGVLAAAARDIEAGELGVRSGVRGGDELGQLGSAFDAMVDELGGALGSARLDSERSRSLLDALVRSNPDGVIEVNVESGSVRSFNPAAHAMLGKSLVPEMSFAEVLASNESHASSRIQDIAAAGAAAQLDLRGTGDEVVHAEVRAMIVEDEGESIAVLVARDIGEWRRELDARHEEVLRLSSPVIELDDDVLLVPVVGELTSERALKLSHSVLEEIGARGAQFCIVDISGITSMDADVANHLLDVMAAARLMGCATVLSGVTPRTVEAMHAADVSWGGVRTVASLRQAVSYVLASKTEA